MIRPNGFVVPHSLPRERVNRWTIRLPGCMRTFVVCSPGIWHGARRDHVHPASLRDHNVEITRIWTVGGRRPIRCACRRRTRRRTLHRWIVAGRDDRPALGVESSRPIELIDEWSTKEEFTIGAVEDVVEAVTVCLDQQLARLPPEGRINEHRSFEIGRASCRE